MPDTPSYSVQPDHSSIPDLRVAIQTLTTGGFALDRVDRRPGYVLIFAHRPDEFGGRHHYCFALSEGGSFDAAQVEAILIPANQFNAQLVYVGEAGVIEPEVSWTRFLSIFGGPVFSTSPLEPEFCDQLIQLGKNQLPVGLVGIADDLFEAYCRVALEFILGVRVIRYGQTRRFEARPDGLVLPHKNFSALYDAKAYSDGYDVTLNTLRQFASYVRDFQERYDAYLPRLNSFLVISGEFQQQAEALKIRSADFLSECGVPLSFVTAGALSEIICLVATFALARRSVDWRRVFTDPIVSPDRVRRELETIHKDGIVRHP